GLETKEYVKYLIGAFRNKDAEVRKQLVADIARVGRPAVKALSDQLDHDQDIVRMGVVLALAEIGPEAGGALRLLQERHKREQVPEIRAAIVWAWSKIQGR